MNLENLKETPAINTELEKISSSVEPVSETDLNESIDSYGRQLRDFGIKECIDGAKEVFTPEVIDNWGNLSQEERSEKIHAYGDKVAESFQLVDYKGIIFEQSEDSEGRNKGDGVIKLSLDLINEQKSPLQVIETITHEMRHQYQTECIHGYHYVPDETRLEWIQGAMMYTEEMPGVKDPWGYKYNPLETDARLAGQTVIMEMTKEFINGDYT